MVFLAGDKFGWDSPAVFRPVLVFFYLALPIHVLGVREFLLTRDIIARANPATLLLTVVPLFTVHFSFGAANPIGGFSFGVAVVSHLLLLVLFTGFSKLADFQTMPSVLPSTLKENTVLWNASFILTASVLLLSSFKAYLCLLLPGLVLNQHIKFRPAGILASQLAVVAYFVFLQPTSTTPFEVVIISTIRILLAFDDRTFSEIQRESLAMGLATVLLAQQDIWLVFVVSCFSFLSLSVSLIAARSRENSAQLIKRAQEAQAFLDHGKRIFAVFETTTNAQYIYSAEAEV
jgi:hypothetical protein